MKKYILLIAILISIIEIKAQDYEAPAYLFDYKVGDSSFVNEPLKPERFKQKNFFIGTQWYGHPKILKALKMNVQEGHQPNELTNDIIPNKDPYYKIYDIWMTPNDHIINARYCYTFKANLYIPDSLRGTLVTKPNDTTRSVFGFSVVNGNIPAVGDINFDRLVLYKDSIQSGTIIVDKPNNFQIKF